MTSTEDRAAWFIVGGIVVITAAIGIGLLIADGTFSTMLGAFTSDTDETRPGGGDGAEPDTGTEEGLDARPPSRDLIAQALADGEIDEGAALLYRAYAQFNDPRLPDRFQSPAAAKDRQLFIDAHERLDELSDDARRDLEPYLLRPTDPSSAFTGDDRAAAASLTFATHEGSLAADDPDERVCADGWTTSTLDVTEFRVWVCRSGDWRADVDALMDAEDALGQHWDRMTLAAPDGMGPPVPDDPGEDWHPDADDRIDIYLLDQGWLAPERDDEEAGLGGTDGVAIVTQPFHRATSSGYLLVDRGLVADADELERTLVHELFHILQYAHTYRLQGDGSWFYEATATWAETYYLRDRSAEVHDQLFRDAQESPFSLLTARPSWRPYEAYLWALFMEQEAGPDTIFEVWDQLRGATSDTEVLRAVDAHVPLGDNLPEFAMRVFNADVAGDPIPTRFVHVDPSFPDDVLPRLGGMDRGHTLRSDPVTIDYTAWHTAEVTDSAGRVPVPAGLPPASYRFDVIELPDVDPDEGQPTIEVTADATLQQHQGTAALHALVRDGPDGEYRRVRIDLDEGASFCGAEMVVLVLTNTSTSANDIVGGSVSAERREVPGCALSGTIVTSYQETLDPPESLAPGRRAWTRRNSWEVRIDVRTEDAILRDSPHWIAEFPDDGSSWTVSGDDMQRATVESRDHGLSCERWDRSYEPSSPDFGDTEFLLQIDADGVPKLRATGNFLIRQVTDHAFGSCPDPSSHPTTFEEHRTLHCQHDDASNPDIESLAPAGPGATGNDGLIQQPWIHGQPSDDGRIIEFACEGTHTRTFDDGHEATVTVETTGTLTPYD